MDDEGDLIDLPVAAKVAYMKVSCIVARDIDSHSKATRLTPPNPISPRAAMTERVMETPPAVSSQRVFRSSTPPARPRTLQRCSSEAPAFVKRLYRFRDMCEEKIVRRREEVRKLEVAGCSFAPKLVARKMATPHRRKLARDYQEVTEESTEEVPVQWDFAPKIDKNSQRIARSLQKRTIVDAASSGQKTGAKTETESSELTFRPTINKSSASLARSQPISDILYEDAQRRNAHAGNPQSLPSYSVTVNKQSLRLVSDRFREEFEAAVEPAKELGLSQLCGVLARLHFIRDLSPSETLIAKLAFRLMAGGGKTVKRERLASFLRAVLNLPQETQTFDSSMANRIRKKFREMAITRMNCAEDAHCAETQFRVSKETLRSYFREVRPEDAVFRQRLKVASQHKAQKLASLHHLRSCLLSRLH